MSEAQGVVAACNKHPDELLHPSTLDCAFCLREAFDATRSQLAAERERAERAEAEKRSMQAIHDSLGENLRKLGSGAPFVPAVEIAQLRAALEAAEKRATEAERSWEVSEDARRAAEHEWEKCRAKLKTARAEALEQLARCLIKSAEADGVVTSGEWTAGYNQGMRDGAALARALAADTGEKP